MKKLAGVCLGIFLFISCILIWSFQPPISSNRAVQLRKGMQPSEVRRILGEPNKVYDGQWTYSKPFVFGFVNIHWDTNGAYDGDFNYERF
jgi:hypothetical protein